MGYYGYPEYVPVAKRKEKAQRLVKKLQKKGQVIVPINIEGRTIAKTFWGKAWCNNLEKYADLDSRLPRGRTYVRNGSVIDLKISRGVIRALVSGSEIYEVEVRIEELPQTKWKKLLKESKGKIDSFIELLQGKVSKGIMEIMIKEEHGLFPDPKEIHFNCDCYDYADMCKHVAAVLYGVGSRLDYNPEDLFLLRGVNHEDLITKEGMNLKTEDSPEDNKLKGDLKDIFGIEIDHP